MRRNRDIRQTKTNDRGGLVSLRDRIGAYRMAKRHIRMEDRSESRKLAVMAMGRANASLQVVGRGFFGRLKWLLLGR